MGPIPYSPIAMEPIPYPHPPPVRTYSGGH